MISTENFQVNSLFPYETFPIRLEFGEKKDTTLCYFQCDEHLQKYITRHKLDKRKIKVIYRDGDPAKSGKGNKNKIRQGTTKTSSRSTTTTSRSTKKLDPSGDTNCTRKPKSTAAKPKAKSKPKPKSK